MILKNISILLMIFLCGATASANDYLISIDLNEQRLDPVFQSLARPVAELGHSAIAVINANDLYQLKEFTYAVIDEDPQQKDYYLIYTNNDIDLEQFGEIIYMDGREYLMRLM